MKARNALVAILARINGEWDNPQLQSYGPLLPNEIDDIKFIASLALAELEREDYAMEN
jgi:hypothetical protein